MGYVRRRTEPVAGGAGSGRPRKLPSTPTLGNAVPASPDRPERLRLRSYPGSRLVQTQSTPRGHLPPGGPVIPFPPHQARAP